jgi:murein DD-endopeptidase MepM/ murein hydrolase activator NlpD
MRQKRSGKISEFFADKGFYIILILCIAAIGISGYVLFFSGSDKPDDTLYIGGSGDGDIPESESPGTHRPQETELQTEIPEHALRRTEVLMAPGDDEKDDDTETVSGGHSGDVLSGKENRSGTGDNARGSAGDSKNGSAVDSAQDNKSGSTVKGTGTSDPGTAPSPSPKPVIASFYVWPVNGEIIERFCVDELVFNRTLEDWRVHPGIDIAAGLGTQVCAMGDGIVEDVYTDELMGVTVVIDHGNKTKSVYRNLMESVTVSPGDIVYAGDVIGGVGQTAENELLDPPHLHLELIREGAQIDPCELLP